MPPALLKLLWLKLRGAVRRALRVQGNPKRVILLVVGIAFASLWLGQMALFTARSGPHSPEFMNIYGPLGLAAFMIFSLLASGGDGAIAFQPAEVDFLFPGPFSRRQLLAYKLLTGMVASLFTALIFSLAFLRHAGSWPSAFLGFLLALWFIQLLGTGAALAKQIVGEMAYTTARRVAIGVVLVAIAAAAYPFVIGRTVSDIPNLVREINDSTLGRVLLAPLKVYTFVITSDTLLGALRWGALGVGLNSLLAFAVLRLDADYLEASIRASERIAERLRRFRSGGMFAPAASGGKPLRSRHAAGTPWLFGAGPIAWRQATTLRRSGKRWAIQLVFLVVFAGFILGSTRHIQESHAGVGIGVGVLAYLTVIMAAMLRFDFRADLDHIETLKSLPLDPRSIALGEVLLPAAMLGAVQAMIIAASTWMFHWRPFVIIAAGAAIPVFNLLLLGVENLLFLLFPARLSNRGVADFSLIGRQMLLLMGKFLIFGVIAAVAGGAAFGAQFATGSWIVGIAVAWIIVAMAAIGALLGVAMAFRAFDVSSDIPPA